MRDGGCAAELLTMAGALDAAAEQSAGRIGWIFDDVPVPFAEMRREADNVARAMLHFGIGRGDIVAAWLPNLREFAACQFACARIGAILTAINTRAKTLELQHTLAHSGAKLLVMVDQFLRHDFRATLLELCPEAAGSHGRLVSASFPALRQVVSLSAVADHAMPWTDFIAAGRATDPAALAMAGNGLALGDAVLLQYTSGTTSRPKGALLNNRYVTYLGADLMHGMGVKPDQRVLNTQPFYHIGGSCCALTAPLTTFCCSVILPYYEPGAALAAIERHGCVARSGYGAMYIMEMAQSSFSKEKTRTLRTGWCVGPPELLEEVQAKMGVPQLLQIYGSTEANGTTGWFDDPWDKRSETCGRPLPGTELRIVSPADGRVCDVDEVGEIALRGPYCMNAYLNQPEETAKVIDADGWYHTGDLGSLDADGFMRFRGRLKNMLKIGGENVSAEEVETVLLQHPAIRQAAVFGVPDPRLQEVVFAAVELRGPEMLSEDDVVAYCAKRMANFRVPRHVRFVTEWPLTGSGKIQKHVLRTSLLESPAA